MQVKKWGLLLAQGILLGIAGIALLFRHGRLLPESGIIVAATALLTSLMAITGFINARPGEKDTVELLAGIFCGIGGLLYLFKSAIPLENDSWFFTGFILLNAFLLLYEYWQYKSEINWWWVSILLLAFSFYLVLPLDTIQGTKLLPASVGMGIQLLVSGAGLIILAYIYRKLDIEYTKTLFEIIHSKRRHKH